jgi:hypothetical protein
VDKWITGQNLAYSFINEKLTPAYKASSSDVDKLSTSKNRVDGMWIKLAAMGISARNYKGCLLYLSP